VNHNDRVLLSRVTAAASRLTEWERCFIERLQERDPARPLREWQGAQLRTIALGLGITPPSVRGVHLEVNAFTSDDDAGPLFAGGAL
jgi:hypothetical protein